MQSAASLAHRRCDPSKPACSLSPPKQCRQLSDVGRYPACLSLFWGALFIRVGRKQQRTDGIPHADDFTQSKVSDSLLVGFLGSLETRCNSEDMRAVVYRFPKLDFEGGPHFLLHTANPPRRVCNLSEGRKPCPQGKVLRPKPRPRGRFWVSILNDREQPRDCVGHRDLRVIAVQPSPDTG